VGVRWIAHFIPNPDDLALYQLAQGAIDATNTYTVWATTTPAVTAAEAGRRLQPVCTGVCRFHDQFEAWVKIVHVPLRAERPFMRANFACLDTILWHEYLCRVLLWSTDPAVRAAATESLGSGSELWELVGHVTHDAIAGKVPRRAPQRKWTTTTSNRSRDLTGQILDRFPMECQRVQAQLGLRAGI
jgi:hypothetical protein